MASSQPRKPCLGIFFCAAAGILLSELFPCNLPAAAIAVCCFGGAMVAGRRGFPFYLLVITIFLVRHELDWRRNPGRVPIDFLDQGNSFIQATGVVNSDPVAAGYAYHTPHWRFEAEVTRFVCDGRAYHFRFPAEVYWTGPPPAWGDEVSLNASISPTPLPSNPGEFNIEKYLGRKGIFAELSCHYESENRVLAHGRGNPVAAWARDARAVLQRRLTLGIDDDAEIAGLVQTITLGVKEETSLEDRELFQRVGALHLFVVNGLHVALLAGILAFLLKPLRIRRRLFAVVIIPVLFAYALITGLSPGSVRAAVMASVMFGASFVERRPFSFNTLAAAGLILLLWDTNELFEQGFEFSFGVVSAILLLSEAIRRPILPLGLPDPYLPRILWTRWQRARDVCWRRVSDLAAVSIAASAGSFPFSAGYFNLAAPSGFLSNLLLVPIACCILAEAIFSLLASGASSLSLLFNNTNWLLASAMLGVVRGFALLPGGHFFVSTSSASPPECRLTILDLEPGQAIVIESHGSVWLVDCGNSSSYSRIVRPFLESHGVNRLDGLILTHGAAPAIGAAQEVIADFAPREIVESSVTDRSVARRNLNAALETFGKAKTLVETGDQLQLSPEVTCSVLFPPAGFEGRTAADKSLILRIQDGTESVLLMSDSAFTGEHWLLDHGHDARASVVVMDGQSDDLAGSDAFMRSVRPAVAVRGEPSFSALTGQDRRWAGGIFRLGITPFMQSAAGAVIIELSQSRLAVSGFANGQHFDEAINEASGKGSK